jgi:hypothetical protein
MKSQNAGRSFGHDFMKLIFREVSSAKHRSKKTLELSSTEHNKFSDGIYRFRYSRFRNTFETHKMMSRTQANDFVLNSLLVITLKSNFQKSNPKRKNRCPSVIVQIQREQTKTENIRDTVQKKNSRLSAKIVENLFLINKLAVF